MKIYRYSSMTHFTENEINQIVSLVKEMGRSLPIDRRCYTKNVLKWAKSFDLIYDGEQKRWKNEVSGKFYINTRFDLYYLPAIALWRLVDPIIGKSTGYSISSYKEWESLNIAPTSSKFHTDRDMAAMYDILGRLDQYHFIILQSAGTIWQITRLSEDKWITDNYR
jgi:hypothetical protein